MYNNPIIPSFYVWKRYEFYRRQIHKRQPSKGGIREKYGGSGLACSYSKGYVGIATFKKSQRWIVPEHTIKRYYSNLIQNMEGTVHPPPYGGGLLAR
jgi:hypothetical protein